MLIFVKLPATKIDYVGLKSNYQLPRLMHQLPTNYTYYTYITILKRKFLIKIFTPPTIKINFLIVIIIQKLKFLYIMREGVHHYVRPPGSHSWKTKPKVITSINI